jgi:hypothetical protein
LDPGAAAADVRHAAAAAPAGWEEQQQQLSVLHAGTAAFDDVGRQQLLQERHWDRRDSKQVRRQFPRCSALRCTTAAGRAAGNTA